MTPSDQPGGTSWCDGAWVIEPDSALPAVTRHLPPWLLRGDAYLFVVRMPASVTDRELFVPPGLLGKRRSRLAFVMFVDYAQANCGPYRELLIAPAAFALPKGTHPSVTRLYVSTYESVVNGRINWAIPKDRADFVRDRGPNGSAIIRLSREGQPLAELTLRAYGPALPALTALLPERMRTLVQLGQGKRHFITLSPSGRMRLAKVESWRFDPTYFPDIARGRVLFGAHIPAFELTFPVAKIDND